jgi:hypothetical protein
MERILTVHPAEGSLAKLMLLIGFGYNQGLLIEEIALNNAAAALCRRTLWEQLSSCGSWPCRRWGA